MLNVLFKAMIKNRNNSMTCRFYFVLFNINIRKILICFVGKVKLHKDGHFKGDYIKYVRHLI